jgi:hypothetical protein
LRRCSTRFSLLRIQVRDRKALVAAQEVDPRSAVLVEFLRRLVLELEGVNPDDPAVLKGGSAPEAQAEATPAPSAGGKGGKSGKSAAASGSAASKNNQSRGSEASAAAGAAEVRAFLSGCGLEHFAEALLAFGVESVADLCDLDIVTDDALRSSANGLGFKPAQLNKFRKAAALRLRAAALAAPAHAAAPAVPVPAPAAAAPSVVRAACERLRIAVGDGSDAWRTLRKILTNIAKVQRFPWGSRTNGFTRALRAGCVE